MSEFLYLAKTFVGLEDVLAQELESIGAKKITKLNRAVSFIGDKALLYRANLWLRTASRVLRHIATFNARNTDELYEGTYQIRWDEYMETDTTFVIHSTVYSETFTHSLYVTQRIKDAIVDFWIRHRGQRPNVDIQHPKIIISVHVSHDEVSLWLDSSGESLHKRGYKVAQTQAPLNEAMAAGLILLTGWRGQCDLYDPMCGSGTFLIEAGLIAQNIPPGIFRNQFAFELWNDFDKDLLQEEYNDDSREKESEHVLYGADASFYATQTTLKNVKQVNLTDKIKVKQIRVEEWRNKIDAPSLIITNPPYGLRLKNEAEVMNLYVNIGNMFKHCFTNADAWVLSGNPRAIKKIGLRPSKKIKVLNGEIECSFNQYKLFAGSRKEFLRRTNG